MPRANKASLAAEHSIARAHAATAMTTTPTEPAIYGRARVIAEGLFRTKRAGRHGVVDRGMVKLERTKGGFYWISLDGSRVFRGVQPFNADELQPKFIDAMERAGR